MKLFTAPDKIELTKSKSVFLAGSIEQDKAIKWQDLVIKELNSFDVALLNPRREKWDSSWEQTIDNPNFNEQVTWELDGLDQADIILIYFDPNTKSPISLLELGLYATSGQCLVCCPDGFWRKGNVDIVCKKYQIDVFTDLQLTIKELKTRLK